MTSDERQPVRTIDPKTYGAKGQFETHLLEQYKLLRNTVGELSSDRNSQSRINFAISSAIIGIISYAFLRKSGDVAIPYWGLFLICTILSVFGWISNVAIGKMFRTFDISLRAKYILLRKYEEYLPAPMFAEEWLERENLGYTPLSSLLITFAHWMTIIFGCLTALFIVLLIHQLDTYFNIQAIERMLRLWMS